MNERIRELYEQARLSAKSIDADIDPKGWMDLYHRKFAELIVRECIVDFYRRYLDTTSNEDITVQVERYIQSNFGVEE